MNLNLLKLSPPARNLANFFQKVTECSPCQVNVFQLVGLGATFLSASSATKTVEMIADWLYQEICEPGSYLATVIVHGGPSMLTASFRYEELVEINERIAEQIEAENRAREGYEEPKKVVIHSLALVARHCHALSVEKGWWDAAQRQPDMPVDRDLAERVVPEKLALIHSEVSEALEVYRLTNTGPLQYGLKSEGGKPVGFDSELADVVIRVFDLAGALGIDIERAILDKHAYNQTRPYRHGGKRA